MNEKDQLMSSQTNKDAWKTTIKNYLEKNEKNYKDIFDHLDALPQQQLYMFFVDDISLDIQNFLLKENYNLCIRALNIIEDLLKNYEPEFSRAVNDSGMALSLSSAATRRKLVTYQQDEWNQFQMRIRGLFLFWFNKYQYEEDKYKNLIRYYKQMRQKRFQFPVQSLDISPRKRKQKIQKQAQQLENNIILRVALEEILPIIEQAQKNLQHHPEKLINKQYVKLLKAKNKYFYQLSTRETSSFTEQNQQNILRYSKRLKNIIKRIYIIQEKIVEKHQRLMKEPTNSQIVQQPPQGKTTQEDRSEQTNGQNVYQPPQGITTQKDRSPLGITTQEDRSEQTNGQNVYQPPQRITTQEDKSEQTNGQNVQQPPQGIATQEDRSEQTNGQNVQQPPQGITQETLQQSKCKQQLFNFNEMKNKQSQNPTESKNEVTGSKNNVI